MTDQRTDLPNGKTDTAATDGPASPGRRLLLGGIPVAVTLASRPALAFTGQCSVSNALSGNLSHPLPAGTNCGMTPLTWCNLSGTNQLWPRTAMYPSTTYISACGAPTIGSVWTCGNQSLLAALQGSLSIQCKVGGKSVTLNAGLFGEQVAASLLNAAAFAPTNYPKTLSQIMTMAQSVWLTSPHDQTTAQHALDNITTQLGPLNLTT